MQVNVISENKIKISPQQLLIRFGTAFSPVHARTSFFIGISSRNNDNFKEWG